MKYIELSPSEIKSRWGSFYSLGFSSNRDSYNQNLKLLSEIIGDEYILHTAMINHAVLKDFVTYCGQAPTIFEEIGEKDSLNEWSHQFHSIYEAKNNLKEKALKASNEAKENIILHKKTYKVFKKLAFLHLLPKRSIKRINALTKLLEILENFNESKIIFHTEYLTSRLMNENTPSLNDEFWVVGTDYGTPVFEHFKVVEVRVYDPQDPEKENVLEFSVSLENVKPDVVDRLSSLSIDSDRLKNSDGNIYHLSLNDYKAFRNESDARAYLKNFIDKQIEHLQKFTA